MTSRPPRLLAVLAVASACSSSSSSSGPAAPTPGPVARFKATAGAMPDFLDVPFPSDVYLAGGKVATIPNVSAILRQNSAFLTHELSKLDGFSRTALALFYVDDTSKPVDENGNPVGAALDAASLPGSEAACVADTSAVYLLDLAETDPTRARVPCRVVLQQDTNVAANHPVLAVGPARGVVLAPAHRYAAVLTSRAKTAGGRAVQASEDFLQVAVGSARAPAAYLAAYPAVQKLLAPAFAAQAGSVVAIAPFTTNDATKELYTLRDALEATPKPPITWDAASMAPMVPAVFAAPVGGKLPSGATASLDDWLGVVASSAHLPDGSDDPDENLPVRAHDAIASVGTGVFVAQNYLTGYEGAQYNALDVATFTKGASGDIQPAADQPTDKIWVSFAVPTVPAPSTGYPVVIFQHGLGGTREDFLGVANPLCQKGWVVAAIDSITFGARAPEKEWQVDAANDFSSSPGAKYKGPDGFGDANAMGAHNGLTDLFGNLLDVGAIRDQFRQAEIDTAQVVRALQGSPTLTGLALGGGAAPVLDPSHIGYVGQSLGSIEGAVAAAVEPGVSAWVLNVGGGGLALELASHGPIVYGLLSGAAGLLYGMPQATLDPGHPLITLLQTALEPGDPLVYAGNLVQSPQPLAGKPTRARNVFQVEVVYDEWVPNEADEALARAGGWGLGQPNVGSNADVLNIQDLDANPWRTPLVNVAADASGQFHDTPQAGVTAIVVQSSPATHGDNLVSSTGTRAYCIPYASYASSTPFVAAPTFTVPEPYLQTQASIALFLSGAFAGQVPVASVPLGPVRDLDADGVPDAQDPAPCDPTQK